MVVSGALEGMKSTKLKNLIQLRVLKEISTKTTISCKKQTLDLGLFDRAMLGE